jgi:hypothetical protein
MYKSNQYARSSGKVVFLNLFLLFLTSILVGSTSSTPTNKGFESVVNHLRLPFVHKLSSLPTSLEKYVLPSYEGTTFLLHEKRERAFLLENTSIATKDTSTTYDYSWKDVERGGGFGLSSLVPAGYNPFGYQITELGKKFLGFDGSLDSDIGRFLASVKTRKRFDGIKSQWLEILRVSKVGQSMRIYRSLKELIAFCLEAGFLD